MPLSPSVTKSPNIHTARNYLTLRRCIMSEYPDTTTTLEEAPCCTKPFDQENSRYEDRDEPCVNGER
jgi:hypothetical protein